MKIRLNRSVKKYHTHTHTHTQVRAHTHIHTHVYIHTQREWVMTSAFLCLFITLYMYLSEQELKQTKMIRLILTMCLVIYKLRHTKMYSFTNQHNFSTDTANSKTNQCKQAYSKCCLQHITVKIVGISHTHTHTHTHTTHTHGTQHPHMHTHNTHTCITHTHAGTHTPTHTHRERGR